MAYSGDGVYRFSTLDTPTDHYSEPTISPSEDAKPDMMDIDSDDPDEGPSNLYSNSNLDVGVVTPVQKYLGARNIETVKDGKQSILSRIRMFLTPAQLDS